MGIALMFIQQWSGVNAVLFNINTLTTKAGTVGFAGVQVFCTLLASVFIETRGRRFFLALSAFGMCASCVVFGCTLQANLSSSYSLVCALAYIAFFSFGLGPMPWGSSWRTQHVCEHLIYLVIACVQSFVPSYTRRAFARLPSASAQLPTGLAALSLRSRFRC